mmetsp:Transcript_15441/g.29915  ORF Transcript_15441/g.29915 Transcript_15441/m.29915 type:complete len:122 (-) Transcript_15441:128-493(-)
MLVTSETNTALTRVCYHVKLVAGVLGSVHHTRLELKESRHFSHFSSFDAIAAATAASCLKGSEKQRVLETLKSAQQALQFQESPAVAEINLQNISDGPGEFNVAQSRPEQRTPSRYGRASV